MTSVVNFGIVYNMEASRHDHDPGYEQDQGSLGEILEKSGVIMQRHLRGGSGVVGMLDADSPEDCYESRRKLQMPRATNSVTLIAEGQDIRFMVLSNTRKDRGEHESVSTLYRLAHLQGGLLYLEVSDPVPGAPTFGEDVADEMDSALIGLLDTEQHKRQLNRLHQADEEDITRLRELVNNASMLREEKLELGERQYELEQLRRYGKLYLAAQVIKKVFGIGPR